MVKEDTFRRVLFFRYILLLVICLFIGALVSALLLETLTVVVGIKDWGLFLKEIKENADENYVQILRTAAFLTHIATFLLPVYLFISFKDRFIQLSDTPLEKIQKTKRNKLSYLFLDKLPSWYNLILSLGIILLSFPLAASLYYFNIQITPEIWINTDSLALNKAILHMPNTGTLLFNILLLGLAAGIGEELLFRGLIQRIFVWNFESVHWGIWISASLFSIIHFEAQAFFPRLVLGALFGYLLWWTNNLWIPILAHIFYNSWQVGLQFLSQDLSGFDLEGVHLPDPIWILSGGLGTTILLVLLYRWNTLSSSTYLNTCLSLKTK